MPTRSDAYLHARVSVMMSRLLTPEQLAGLLTSIDTEEAVPGMAALQLQRASNVSLEQRTMTALLAEFLVLVRPLKGQEREFLLHWAHRLELSNLKAVLRGKLTGQSVPMIRADLVDMGPFATLPLEALLATEDFLELLRLLETTPYADIARQARAVFETEHELFAVDASVDRHYFASSVARYVQLQHELGAAFRELMASILNRVNLVWLLRYRFVYALPPAQTFYLLIPSPFLLNTERLSQLVKLESFEEVLAALPAPLRDHLAGAANPFEVTRRMEQLTQEAALRVLRRSPSALARAFAYLMARELDLRKMRAIAKAHTLQLDPAVARSVLELERPVTVH